MNTIRVQHLGRISYAEGWDLQRELLEQRIQDKIEDTVLVLEHDPVYTLGKKFPGLKKLQEANKKDLFGTPLYMIERGGEATYHGPGQLVCYPIFKVPRKMGPVLFMRLIETAIMTTLQEFQIESSTIDDATGVWVKDSFDRNRKVASIGIAMRKSVSYHGLALNIDTDLEYFKKIKPCGFESNVMINMKDLVDKLDYTQVQNLLVQNFCRLYRIASLSYQDSTRENMFEHNL